MLYPHVISLCGSHSVWGSGMSRQMEALLSKQMGGPAHPGHAGEFVPHLCLHWDCSTPGVWFNERHLPSVAVGWGTHWLSWEDWDAKLWRINHLSCCPDWHEQWVQLERANLYCLKRKKEARKSVNAAYP